MPFLSSTYNALSSSTWLAFLVTAVACLLYPAAVSVRNIYFHPLSKFPGPKLWVISRIFYVRHMLAGTLVHTLDQIHRDYGDIVRVGVDEISFAVPEAWKDIYDHKPGVKSVTKDTTWYIAPNDMPQNIVTTNDPRTHARMKTLLNNSFTADAVHQQRPLIEGAMDMAIKRMKELVKSSGGVIDMTDWVNFFTVDIIGDLAFGESFNCMRDSQYHPWIKTLYNFLKGMVFAASTRFFPGLEKAVQWLLPRSIMENQKKHTEFANAKIDRRIALKTDRPDFMTPFLKGNANFQVMSLGEIQSTFALLIVAGSETTATSLLGIINHLAQDAAIRHKLTDLLHLKYKSEAELNLESVKNIPYLEAVIQEGLRLCNPVPGGLPRVVPRGGGVYAGVYLPAGTRVSVRPHCINHSDAFFHRAKEFLPERWLPADERPQEFSEDVLSASRPFSTGPAACIGQPLAWAELRIFLARLLYAFDFEELPGQHLEWESLRQAMVVEKEPMPLRLRLSKET